MLEIMKNEKVTIGFLALEDLNVRFETDVIAAIATALSDSGIGIIRISGNGAIEIADSLIFSKNGKRFLSEMKSHTIHYGFVMDEKGTIMDEVMVSVFRAPKSYTKEDVVEINCHGGILVTKKILELVIKAGARLAQPGEFTKRAFLNGRIDLTEAEAVMDLIHSKNETSLKASTSQLRGDLSKKIRSLREKIIYEIAFIESALDDPEHVSLEGYPENLEIKCGEFLQEIQGLLDTAENGRMIRDGISTVIVGKPNAGKSSLLNMILGQERAIVTDVAGTTRDVLEECVNLGGIHLNVIDTAGIRDTEDQVERIGVEKAKKYAKDADLILYVVDTSVDLDQNDREILGITCDKKTIFLLNKSDLLPKVDEENVISLRKEIGAGKTEDQISMIHTSTAMGEGLEQLEKEIEKLVFRGDVKKNDEIMITNLRHKEALINAKNALLLVKKSLEDRMPEDFYSIDLMEAYGQLGIILGEEIGDDLVEEIFSKFCMGK